ncbi:MAG: hypothetical protein HUU47_08605 [Bacteroidetes bacterium]|nr:hypothetical protein [Bacteroidota bacterium]
MAFNLCIILKEKNGLNLNGAICTISNGTNYTVDSLGKCCMYLPLGISNQLIIYKEGYYKKLIRLKKSNNFTYIIELKIDNGLSKPKSYKTKYLGNKQKPYHGNFANGLDLVNDQELYLLFEVNEIDCSVLEEFNFYISKIHTFSSPKLVVSVYLPGIDTLRYANPHGREIIGHYPKNLIFKSDTIFLKKTGWINIKINKEIITNDFIVGIKLNEQETSNNWGLNYIYIGEYKINFFRESIRYLKSGWIKIKNENINIDRFIMYSPNQFSFISANCKLKILHFEK